MDAFDRLYEISRALGEDTRFRIYRAMWESAEPVTVSDLAETFDLHPNAIRSHLARLEAAGLVASRVDRGDRAGRPRRLYRARQEPLDLELPPRPTA